MRVAVTGAGGQIGRALVSWLQRHEYDVSPAPPKDRMDLILDVPSVRTWIEDARPDAVIHLAGTKPPAPGYMMLANNAGGTHNILEAVRALRPDAKVLVVSSAAVLGDPPTSYGVSKQITEVLAQHARESGVAATVLRIANVVGVGGDTTSLVPQLLERIEPAEPGSTLEIRDADCTRDFILLDDVLEAFDVLLNRPGLPALVELGSGEETAVYDVALKIGAAVNPSVEFVPLAWTGSGVRRSVSDIAALRSLGWNPRYTASNALDIAIERLRKERHP